ncbi:hypothetical protein CMUS01_07473 [Colletotrichum musicola]|uniref:Uncharacterized protein n=1 Tax=Colletotrichum musicola TaxID=2175873 RepID=A0A8H6KH11_9PEZI|nr:hypothetical protein CMUS01_07473 [Colletotrichum musicola]
MPRALNERQTAPVCRASACVPDFLPANVIKGFLRDASQASRHRDGLRGVSDGNDFPQGRDSSRRLKLEPQGEQGTIHSHVSGATGIEKTMPARHPGDGCRTWLGLSIERLREVQDRILVNPACPSGLGRTPRPSHWLLGGHEPHLGHTFSLVGGPHVRVILRKQRGLHEDVMCGTEMLKSLALDSCEMQMRQMRHCQVQPGNGNGNGSGSGSGSGKLWSLESGNSSFACAPGSQPCDAAPNGHVSCRTLVCIMAWHGLRLPFLRIETQSLPSQLRWLQTARSGKPGSCRIEIDGQDAWQGTT